MQGFHNRLVPFLIAAGAAAAGGWEMAGACQICIPFPKKSAADFLIEAEAVVLAREDPDRAFHFSAVEILKGDPGDEKIDLFLDSTTRRILAAHSERAIILAKMKKGAASSEAWRRIGTADQDLGPVVRSILKASDDWTKAPGARIAFFAERLGHENVQVRTLAHLEIARAPYDAIRNCSGALSREEIRSFLDNLRYIEWHPLYILLLAQSENSEDRKLIARSFESSARFRSTLLLAAWATALVEIEEEAGIARIEKLYFEDSSRKPEELKAVYQALSVQGTGGHTHLRDRIVTSYQVLLKNHPKMAAPIVRDLTAWKRFDLAGDIAAYLATKPAGLDFQTTLRLRAYAKRSEAGEG